MPSAAVNGTTVDYEVVGQGPTCLVLAGWPYGEFEANKKHIEGNFAKALDLTIEGAAATIVPATFENGEWRAIRAEQDGEAGGQEPQLACGQVLECGAEHDDQSPSSLRRSSTRVGVGSDISLQFTLERQLNHEDMNSGSSCPRA